MNCRIPDSGLRAVCRELLRRNERTTHRTLRKALRERFGAAGKTARVLRVWREEHQRLISAKPNFVTPATPSLPTDVRELQERLVKAEASVQQLTVRAELAELRESSHQERWAVEIDRLREQLRSHRNAALEVRTLQTMVSRLSEELRVYRAARAAGEGGA